MVLSPDMTINPIQARSFRSRNKPTMQAVTVSDISYQENRHPTAIDYIIDNETLFNGQTEKQVFIQHHQKGTLPCALVED